MQGIDSRLTASSQSAVRGVCHLHVIAILVYGDNFTGPANEAEGLTPASQYSSGYNRKKREKGEKEKKERKKEKKKDWSLISHMVSVDIMYHGYLFTYLLKKKKKKK